MTGGLEDRKKVRYEVRKNKRTIGHVENKKGGQKDKMTGQDDRGIKKRRV